MTYSVISSSSEMADELFELMHKVTKDWEPKEGILKYDREKFKGIFTEIAVKPELIPVLTYNERPVGFMVCQLSNTFSFADIIPVRADLYMPFVEEEHTGHAGELLNEVKKQLLKLNISTVDSIIYSDWGDSVRIALEGGFNLVQTLNREAKVKIKFFDHNAFSRNFGSIKLVMSADIRPAAEAIARILSAKFGQEFSPDIVMGEVTHAANDAENHVILKYHEGEIVGVCIFAEDHDRASIRRVFASEVEWEEDLFSYAMEHFANTGYEEVVLLFDPSPEFKSRLRAEGIVFKTISGYYSCNING